MEDGDPRGCCSAACRAVHVACRGCGVLSGPEHAHLLRDGYCESLLVEDDGLPPVRVPLYRACAETLAPVPSTTERAHPLRVLREARGLTRRGLAERAGVSLQTVARLEEARHQPRPETLDRLAAALGMEPSALIDLVA